VALAAAVGLACLAGWCSPPLALGWLLGRALWIAVSAAGLLAVRALVTG
jgi:hypothetical protein